MQQIVNVTIDESGRSIADSKSIGLQYETGVAQFVIAPDPSWVSDQYFYYLIVSPPEDSDKKQYAVPLVNQGGTFVFKISSGITWNVGNYKFAFISMSKELTDGIVPTDGIVSISTAWNCKIEKSILDYAELQKQPADANFQLLYTDLMALSVELRNAINNIDLEGNYAREQGDEAKKQAEYAKEKGDYAKEKGDYANTKAELANTKAEYANTQGNYAKTQGEQAQTKGNKAQEQGNTAEQQGQYATEQGNYAKRVGDTVQGQIDRLRANQVQGTASGKEIVVADAAEIESNLHISGNSEQDSRSGKNLLNPIGPNKEATGIKVTNNGDGTFTVKGTSTGSVAFSLTDLATYPITLEANKSYTQSVIAVNGDISKIGILIAVKDENGEQTNNYIVNDSTKNITAERTVSKYEVYVGSGRTVDCTFKVQLEEGTVATDYEPYGVQPSPDYPSEIRSVKSKSDNLFDINGDVNTRYNGDKNTWNTVSGNNLTSTHNWGLGHGYGQKIYVGKGTTVTFSAKLIAVGDKGYTGTSPVAEIDCYNENDNSTRVKIEFNLQDMGIVKSEQFIAQTDYIIFAFGAYTTERVSSATFTDIMLNKGSEALPYQPYGYVPVELKVEGNLFNKATAEDGKEITGGAVSANATWCVSDYIPVELGKTYTKNISNGREAIVYDSNKEKISNIVFDATTNKITITNNNVKYIRVNLPISAKETYRFYAPADDKTISLPLGDIQLRSTPDRTRDTFARVDGVWNKVEKIKELHYTKDFWWTLRAEPFQDVVCFQSDMNNGKFSVDGKKIISNLFKSYPGVNFLDNDQNYEGIATAAATNGYIRLKIAKNRLTTLDLAGLQTWLENNLLYVCYELVTPTYTPITDTALISALDELEQLILHKGYNYITATSVNGVKAQLDLSYYKDINAVLNNIMAMVATIGGELNV